MCSGRVHHSIWLNIWAQRSICTYRCSTVGEQVFVTPRISRLFSQNIFIPTNTPGASRWSCLPRVEGSYSTTCFLWFGAAFPPLGSSFCSTEKPFSNSSITTCILNSTRQWKYVLPWRGCCPWPDHPEKQWELGWRKLSEGIKERESKKLNFKYRLKFDLDFDVALGWYTVCMCVCV